MAAATGFLLRWTFDPLVVLPLALAGILYIEGVRNVRRRHPRSGWPPSRTAWYFAGLGLLVIALASPVDYYSDRFFSVHMAQHVLLMMVAAPFILLGRPITLALMASQPPTRKKLAKVTHSQAAHALGLPGPGPRPLRRRPLGRPLQLGLRRRAHQQLRPRGRAHRVPHRGAALLVAHRRSRPGVGASQSPGPPVLPVPGDARDVAPRAGHQHERPRALRALFGHRRGIRHLSAGRPAAGRHDHVGFIHGDRDDRPVGGTARLDGSRREGGRSDG